MTAEAVFVQPLVLTVVVTENVPDESPVSEEVVAAFDQRKVRPVVGVAVILPLLCPKHEFLTAKVKLGGAGAMIVRVWTVTQPVSVCVTETVKNPAPMLMILRVVAPVFQR